MKALEIIRCNDLEVLADRVKFSCQSKNESVPLSLSSGRDNRKSTSDYVLKSKFCNAFERHVSDRNNLQFTPSSLNAK